MSAPPGHDHVTANVAAALEVCIAETGRSYPNAVCGFRLPERCAHWAALAAFSLFPVLRPRSHSLILGQKEKGVPRRDSLLDLLRILHRPGLAHHGDADLAGEAQFGLDSLGDVPCHELGGGVVDLLGLDQDPDLSAGLDGVGLLDPLE